MLRDINKTAAADCAALWAAVVAAAACATPEN